MVISKVLLIGTATKSASFAAKSLSTVNAVLGASALGAAMMAAAPYASVIGTGITVVGGAVKVTKVIAGKRQKQHKQSIDWEKEPWAKKALV